MDHKNEQELAAFRDSMPRLWWAIYCGSLAAGFSKSQAMSIVQASVLAAFGKGPQPNTPTEPDKEDAP